MCAEQDTDVPFGTHSQYHHRRSSEGSRMRPVRVELITYAPAAFFHCQHCELTFDRVGVGEQLRRDQARSALPDDLLQDYQALSDCVHDLLARHGGDLQVRVIDAASVEGVWKSVRHGVYRYSAIVIEGGERRAGIDVETLRSAVERQLTAIM